MALASGANGLLIGSPVARALLTLTSRGWVVQQWAWVGWLFGHGIRDLFACCMCVRRSKYIWIDD